MKRVYSGLFILAVLVLIAVNLAPAGLPGKNWHVTMYIYSAGYKDTLVFGAGETATKCVDSVWGEEERPPTPPAGVLDDRFVGNTSAERECIGQGLRTSFHPGDLSASATLDTFVVKFQPTTQDSDFIVSWFANGTDNTMSTMLNSCIIKGLDPTPATVDMMTGSSFNLTAELGASADSYPVQFKIYASWKPIITGISQQNSPLPATFGLKQNYPNPFNPTTNISFAVKENAFTTITIFNILGQKIATLVEQQMNPGTFTTRWNGVDDRGVSVSSGVYYVRMNASYGSGENFTEMRKIVLMK